MRRNSKVLKVLGISTAVFLAVSIPTYTYAKSVIGNNLLTTTVAAKKAITWKSKAIFKKTVKVKKTLTVLGATVLNSLNVSGDTTLAGLTVTGDSTLAGLTVADTSALNNVTVAGDLTLANGLGLGSLTGLTAGQLIMANADGTPTATTLSGDVTVDSSGVATVITDAVTADSIEATVSEDTTVTDGVIKYRTISADAVLPLLDGVSNTLTTFDTGEVVIDIIINTGAASGTASTVDIGTDGNWGAGVEDADSFIVDHDLNTAGVTRMSMQDEANQAATGSGNPAKTDAAVVTIQSSADISATDFSGNVTILYY